jgi:GT2 family glycosyltransferase
LDLSVIILNWNTRDLLRNSLNSILHPDPSVPCSPAAPPAEIEILVADNASSDDSREMVRAEFPEVKLVCSPLNVGFGAGNNLAVKEATGRYVLFLNSDTIVMPGALSGLVHFADSNPDIGVLGPKLLNEDGSLQYSCRAYPNLGTGFFRNTPLGRLFPNNAFTNDYLMTSFDHMTPKDVDWVSGAALMMRKSIIEEIGAFDEEYFMFCEDVDLCYRVNHHPRDGAQGSDTWRVTYFPDSIIYHLIGKSTDLAPTRMTYEFHRSQYLFYKKHYAATTPLLLKPIIPVGIWLRAIGKMARYRVRRLQRVIMRSDRV